VLPIVLGACSRPSDTGSVTAVDLVRTFDHAEKRPPAGFDVSSYELAGVARVAIAATVPSRAIWSLRLPHHGVFRAFAALAPDAAGAVRIRVGISDDRIYEGLAEAVLVAGNAQWVEVAADLRAYAGWQWSLFYHPDRVTWRIVLASDAMNALPATVLWGSPQILTDTASALDYVRRAASHDTSPSRRASFGLTTD
jgi:hypothetical protein